VRENRPLGAGYLIVISMLVRFLATLADSGNLVHFAVFGSRPAVEFKPSPGLAKFGITSAVLK
jgi:hypothetical protein